MTTSQKNTAQLLADLAGFTGTAVWYRHAIFRKYLYTEGVQYLAENASAYWLIEMIFFFQEDRASVKAEPFQVWTLAVNEDNTAVLTCTDGNDTIIHKHDLSFTDFPLREFSLWFANDVLYLPSEH